MLMSDTLQDFWAEVLSAEAGRIRSAMEGLSVEERRSVMAHLKRMADEAGWSAGQRARAQAALEVLGGAGKGDL
jgi:thymidine phosphorylase